MALTRKFLSALGIEEEKIDEIITAHTETVNGLKEERDKYKDKAQKFDDLSDQYSEATKELDKLKNGENPFEEQYNELKTEFDNYKDTIAKEKAKNEKVSAFKKLLSEVGISDKRLDSVVKVTDLDTIELENGVIKDADSLKDSLKDEWSDFIVTEEVKGANTANPPTNTGGTTKTREDILKISDTKARQKAMAENPSLFGLE